MPAIDVALVRALLAQGPDGAAGASIRPVTSAGTDNALFRVGEGLVARLPRVRWARAQPAREHRWLGHLAQGLPLAIPEPVFLGQPAAGYPFEWALHRWRDGTNALGADLSEDMLAAERLGEFVASLRTLDAADGPAAGRANNGRGAPLALRSGAVADPLAQLDDLIDVPAARRCWEIDVATPVWAGAPHWVHGDLHGGNLLLVDGRIDAVIDFGTLGVGDPAVDLLPAWTLFSGDARDRFRTIAGLDDAAWARGRAWALSIALIALPYYRSTNPVIVEQSRSVIDAVLHDVVHDVVHDVGG